MSGLFFIFLQHSRLCILLISCMQHCMTPCGVMNRTLHECGFAESSSGKPAPLHCCPRTLACPGIHHLLKYEVSSRAGMQYYWLACFKTFYYMLQCVQTVICITTVVQFVHQAIAWAVSLMDKHHFSHQEGSPNETHVTCLPRLPLHKKSKSQCSLLFSMTVHLPVVSLHFDPMCHFMLSATEWTSFPPHPIQMLAGCLFSKLPYACTAKLSASSSEELQSVFRSSLTNSSFQLITLLFFTLRSFYIPLGFYNKQLKCP